jgi:Ulp1 family protease
MRKYSESLPFAFHKMRETSLYSRQSQYAAVSRRSGRRMRQFSGADNINAIDCEVVEGDAPDTADIEKILGVRSLPHPFNQDNMSIQLLTCFQTGQILDSVVIDEYVSLLATHFSDVHFPRIYNFDNKKYHSWTTKEREQYFNSHFKSRLSKSVFAINTGFHWVAVKVDTVQHYIATVCSMQNSLPNELHSILEMFSIGHDTNAFQHFPVTVPHQRNAVDCGPLCCMFLLFLSQDDVSSRSELSYETHFTANQMRMRMFADIRQGHITSLLQKH